MLPISVKKIKDFEILNIKFTVKTFDKKKHFLESETTLFNF